MKFGKRIRTELSAGLLRGSLDYKALKRIAKALRDSTEPTLQQLQHNGHKHRDLDAVTDFFFARLEAEKEKVRSIRASHTDGHATSPSSPRRLPSPDTTVVSCLM